MQLSIRSESLQGMRSIQCTDSGLSWTIDEPVSMGGTNLGPNPLEAVLGAWAGCLSIVIRMVCQENGWPIGPVAVHASGEFDPRGFMGIPGVSPYFSTAEATIEVSQLDASWVEPLTQSAESRCPVSGLLRAAGVHTSVAIQPK